jgi:hypothetical protein
MPVFGVTEPCSLVEVYRRFRDELLSHYIARQPRRQPHLYSAPWEPQMSHINYQLNNIVDQSDCSDLKSSWSLTSRTLGSWVRISVDVCPRFCVVLIRASTVEVLRKAECPCKQVSGSEVDSELKQNWGRNLQQQKTTGNLLPGDLLLCITAISIGSY